MENKVKDVFVTLVSSAHAEDGAQEAPIRLRCRGQIKESPNGFLLKYQEVQQEEGANTATVQDVILSMQPGRVTMSRLGPFGTTMVFVKDRRFEGAYHTPYGDLALALFATQVQCQLALEAGRVHLEYQLDMQGSYAAVQSIDITWQSEGAAL